MTRLQQQWDALAKAARHPAYGRARRAREELRAFAHSLLASDVGAQQPLMQWDCHRPIPDGWRLAKQRYSHHTRLYGSVLIERQAAE